ncbi:MAG: hypothetical protein JNK52_02415 [Zoogloeaceae bacterium]|nr:hypothetical protein [Zoogloeaceae bacterium]
MPYRPTAIFRKNIRGVIYPLTAAVASIYGIRDDGAYPIGAFYTVNIDSDVWEHLGGIWYRPYDSTKITERNIKPEAINLFINGINHGNNTVLASGKMVTWEQIPRSEALQLPSQ